MLIILDRDGVINEDSDEYIKSADEWHPIPGSLEAIAKINHAGHHVVVASNQSGLARGYFTIKILEEIHSKMNAELKKHQGYLNGIYFCPHHPDDHCACRKPKPGLIHQIIQDFKINLSDIIFIGDSISDIKLGLNLSLKTYLVLTGKGEQTLKQHSHELNEVIITENLSTAVNKILFNQ